MDRYGGRSNHYASYLIGTVAVAAASTAAYYYYYVNDQNKVNNNGRDQQETRTSFSRNSSQSNFENRRPQQNNNQSNFRIEFKQYIQILTLAQQSAEELQQAKMQDLIVQRRNLLQQKKYDRYSMIVHQMVKLEEEVFNEQILKVIQSIYMTVDQFQYNTMLHTQSRPQAQKILNLKAVVREQMQQYRVLSKQSTSNLVRIYKRIQTKQMNRIKEFKQNKLNNSFTLIGGGVNRSPNFSPNCSNNDDGDLSFMADDYLDDGLVQEQMINDYLFIKTGCTEQQLQYSINYHKLDQDEQFKSETKQYMKQIKCDIQRINQYDESIQDVLSQSNSPNNQASVRKQQQHQYHSLQTFASNENTATSTYDDAKSNYQL